MRAGEPASYVEVLLLYGGQAEHCSGSHGIVAVITPAERRAVLVQAENLVTFKRAQHPNI